MERSDSRTDDSREVRGSGTATTPAPATPAPVTPPSVAADRAKVTATTGDPALTPDSRTVTPDPARRAGTGAATAVRKDKDKDNGNGPGGADSAEADRLTRRLDSAVGGFVDDPKRAVMDADAVLVETVARLTRQLEERRTALRRSWHGDGESTAGTEELRVALTRYRDMARQLLSI